MDNTTLFAVLVSVLLIQAVALAQTWRQNRKEIGIRDWSLAGVCLALGSLFGAFGLNSAGAGENGGAWVILFGEVSSMAGSSMSVAGWCFAWYGARHFYGRGTPRYMAVVHVTAVFTAIVGLQHLFPLPFEWRTTWVSAMTALFAAMTLYEFLRQRPPRNPVVMLVVLALLSTGITWLIRAIASLDHEAYVTDYAFTFPLALYNGIVASVTFTVSMIVLTNERMHRQLRDQATIDPLTGIMNRRAFYETARPILTDLRRSDCQAAVCLLDIDHFKQINDTHGHAAGDAVLERFAEIARASLREGDLLARYGGEEFALLLRNSSPAEAESVLRRLRETCLQMQILPQQKAQGLTFSAGICHASGPVTVTLEVLLEAADRALYRAKHSGRDRIVHADKQYCEEGAQPQWEGVA